jgi:hypothetical protein
MAVAFWVSQKFLDTQTASCNREQAMKTDIRLNSEKYMTGYFKQEAKELRLKKNREAREQLVTFGVLAFTVFLVTFAYLEADVWVPAFQSAVQEWRWNSGM